MCTSLLLDDEQLAAVLRGICCCWVSLLHLYENVECEGARLWGRFERNQCYYICAGIIIIFMLHKKPYFFSDSNGTSLNKWGQMRTFHF